MQGGDEGQIFYVDSPLDVVTDSKAGDDDLMIAQGNEVGAGFVAILPENVEHLRFDGMALARGIGNALGNIMGFVEGDTIGAAQFDGLDGADSLTGGARNDTLNGGAGNDRIIGNDGNDSLDGGPGDDTMNGGLGSDIFRVDSVGDIVQEVGAGADTVLASVSYTLPIRVEHLVLTGTDNLIGTGNGADNVIVGNAGANTLRGGGGDDTLNGGAGRDVLNGGAGLDTFKFTTASHSPRGGLRDVIQDFTLDDTIDLSQVAVGMVFIGGDPFTDALQVRFEAGILQVNTGGSLLAEMEIRVIGVAVTEDSLIL
jgi:Ca2+-binding RTX toxin-like protein